MLGRREVEGASFYRPHGCVFCAGRGLRGRMGLFEMFRMNSDLACAIADGVNEHELRRLHRKQGGRCLVDDGVEKCLAGLTTVGEVGRVSSFL